MTDPDPRRETVARTIYASLTGGTYQTPPHAFYDVADAVLSVLPECRHEQELAELRAECERHRRANLVRAVVVGWDEAVDGSLIDYANEHGWDAVPWRVAEGIVREHSDCVPRSQLEQVGWWESGDCFALREARNLDLSEGDPLFRLAAVPYTEETPQHRANREAIEDERRRGEAEWTPPPGMDPL